MPSPDCTTFLPFIIRGGDVYLKIFPFCDLLCALSLRTRAMVIRKETLARDLQKTKWHWMCSISAPTPMPITTSVSSVTDLKELPSKTLKTCKKLLPLIAALTFSCCDTLWNTKWSSCTFIPDAKQHPTLFVAGHNQAHVVWPEFEADSEQPCS